MTADLCQELQKNHKPSRATITELIQLCETVEAVKSTIEMSFKEGTIMGRSKEWKVERMLWMIDAFVEQASAGYYPNVRPTREYGIRQQLIYILYCEEKLHNKVMYRGYEDKAGPKGMNLE